MPQIQTVGNPGSWVMKLRENCFYSPAASVLSVVLGLIILAVVGYVFDWGIANAVWDPNPAACREASGALFVRAAALLGLGGRRFSVPHCRVPAHLGTCGRFSVRYSAKTLNFWLVCTKASNIIRALFTIL